MIWNINVKALVYTNNDNFIIVKTLIYEICVSVKNIYFEHNVKSYALFKLTKRAIYKSLTLLVFCSTTSAI